MQIHAGALCGTTRPQFPAEHLRSAEIHLAIGLFHIIMTKYA